MKANTAPRNVIDFARYQQGRAAVKVPAISLRLCRHCSAVLSDGENEDECSSTFNRDAPTRRAVPGTSSRIAPGTAARKFCAD